MGVGDTVTFEASAGPAGCLSPDLVPPEWRWSRGDTLIATIDSLTGARWG